MRVLVVDDEALVALLNEELLSTPDTRCWGRWRRLRQPFGSPVVATSTLPCWTSSQVAVAVVSSSRAASINFMASGRSSRAAAREARQGSDVALGQLSKPYSPDDLVLAVAAAATIMAGARPVHVPQGMELF